MQLWLMVFLSIEVTPITAEISPLPQPEQPIFHTHSCLSVTEGFTSLPLQGPQNRSESHPFWGTERGCWEHAGGHRWKERRSEIKPNAMQAAWSWLRLPPTWLGRWLRLSPSCLGHLCQHMELGLSSVHASLMSLAAPSVRMNLAMLKFVFQ